MTKLLIPSVVLLALVLSTSNGLARAGASLKTDRPNTAIRVTARCVGKTGKALTLRAQGKTNRLGFYLAQLDRRNRCKTVSRICYRLSGKSERCHAPNRGGGAFGSKTIYRNW